MGNILVPKKMCGVVLVVKIKYIREGFGDVDDEEEEEEILNSFDLSEKRVIPRDFLKSYKHSHWVSGVEGADLIFAYTGCD